MRGVFKMFYAELCQWGNISYTSFNGDAYAFFAFKSKSERDEFVVMYGHDDYASAISASQLRRLAGRKFTLEKSCVVPNGYSVEFDRNRLNPLSAKCVLK